MNKLFVRIRYFDEEENSVEEFIDLDSIYNIRRITDKLNKSEYILSFADLEDKNITSENYYSILQHLNVVNLE